MEIQLVDAETFDLVPRAPEILARAGAPDHRIEPEFFQSMLEVSTGVCETPQEAWDDLRTSFARLLPITRGLGVRMVSAGTHPFAHYEERVVSPSPRYHQLIERNQWIARRLMIFGLHVHVGMPSAEACIAIQNELAYDLGLLLGLSASSPFWLGSDTGLASSRITVFETLPTGGVPSLVPDWPAFDRLVTVLERSRAITSVKDLWWDVRPSPRYGTLEIRVCDAMPGLRSTIAVVALIQALAQAAWDRIRAGQRRPPPPDWFLRENKWRASRHGPEADLLLDLDGNVMLLRDLLEQHLASLEPYAAASGPGSPAAACRALARAAASSSSRQRDILSSTGSLVEVTRALADEFEDEFAPRPPGRGA
jgi:carboxylate-amine ligase